MKREVKFTTPQALAVNSTREAAVREAQSVEAATKALVDAVNKRDAAMKKFNETAQAVIKSVVPELADNVHVDLSPEGFIYDGPDEDTSNGYEPAEAPALRVMEPTNGAAVTA